MHREGGGFQDALVVYRTLDAIDPFNPVYALAMAECFMYLQDERAADGLLQDVIGYCEREGTHPQVLARARALQDIFRRRKGNDG